jgi:hypothetical protein
MLEKVADLKQSKGASATDLIKALKLKPRYLIPVLVYKDERGKDVDTEQDGKMVQITGGLYGQLIDFFLDPDLGDFTDPEEGYDIKIKRTGKGKTDTEYSVSAMRPSKIPDKYDTEVDLEGMVKAVIPSYEEVEEKLAEFLASEGTGDTESEDDAAGGDAGGGAPKLSARERRKLKKEADGE